MEDDNLYQIEKLITDCIIQEDVESVYSIMDTEKDPIFNMAIVPYYALFVQSIQEYLGKVYLPKMEAKRVQDIRNYIKSYGESFGKTKRKIQDIDNSQDKQFKGMLKFDFLKQRNMYRNLGTYWIDQKHIIGTTQMYADILQIEDMFDQQSRVFQWDLMVQLGGFVASAKTGFSKCSYQPIVARKEKSIKICYYADLNTNVDKRFFKGNFPKELKLFFLHLLCNMNFVKYVLRKLFVDDNKWVFRVEYIVTYYTYRALCRLKNHCANNDGIKLDFETVDDIFIKGESLFQSKFRNCMMHYGLENRNVLSREYIQKDFYGLIETCFAGMDFRTYIEDLHELSDKMIFYLESRFDMTKIKICNI